MPILKKGSEPFSDEEAFANLSKTLYWGKEEKRRLRRSSGPGQAKASGTDWHGSACELLKGRGVPEGFRAREGFSWAPEFLTWGREWLQRNDKPLSSLLFLKIVHWLKTGWVCCHLPRLGEKLLMIWEPWRRFLFSTLRKQKSLLHRKTSLRGHQGNLSSGVWGWSPGKSGPVTPVWVGCVASRPQMGSWRPSGLAGWLLSPS